MDTQVNSHSDAHYDVAIIGAGMLADERSIASIDILQVSMAFKLQGTTWKYILRQY